MVAASIHPGSRRFFAKWAEVYWLRSVPNLALWWIWKHHGESPNAGQEPGGETQCPTVTSG